MRMVATVSRILRLNSWTIQNTHSPKSNPRMILSTHDTLCQPHSFVSYSHEVYRFDVSVSLSLPTKNAPIPYESSILLCPIYMCTKHPSLETRPTKQECIFGISSSHQLPTASCHRVESSPGSDLPKPLKVAFHCCSFASIASSMPDTSRYVVGSELCDSMDTSLFTTSSSIESLVE